MDARRSAGCGGSRSRPRWRASCSLSTTSARVRDAPARGRRSPAPAAGGGSRTGARERRGARTSIRPIRISTGGSARRRRDPRRRDPGPLDRPRLRNRPRRRRIARDLGRRRPGRVGLARSFRVRAAGTAPPARRADGAPQAEERPAVPARRVPRRSRQPRRRPVEPVPARAAARCRPPAARSAAAATLPGRPARTAESRVQRPRPEPGRRPPAAVTTPAPEHAERAAPAPPRGGSELRRRASRTSLEGAATGSRRSAGSTGADGSGHRAEPRRRRSPVAPWHEAPARVRAIPSAPPRLPDGPKTGRPRGGRSGVPAAQAGAPRDQAAEEAHGASGLHQMADVAAPAASCVIATSSDSCQP